jgi:hypothetical protein
LGGSAVSRLVGDAQQRREKVERAKGHTRDRSWDAQRVKASYDLPKEVRDAVVEVAEAEGVPAYEIARMFLERGLEIYEAGGLEAFGKTKKVASAKHTLY